MAAGAKRAIEDVAREELEAWVNEDEGAPETEWHKGYEAARDMVRIRLKYEEKPE